MAIPSSRVGKGSRASRSRLAARRPSESAATPGREMPRVTKTSDDLFGSLESGAMPAQSLRLNTWATSRLLASVQTSMLRTLARVTPRTAKAMPSSGDPWQYLWGIWYVGRAFSTFPPPLLWTDLVFFPLGFDIPFLPGVGLILGPGALLKPVFGLVLTYNLLWWLSFALAGYAMYVLVRRLLGEWVVAFVCGGLFAFSSYRLIHSVEHLPIVMASFLVPLFALALLRVGERPSGGRAAACALVLAASAGISWYCTVSLLVYLGLATLVLFWRHGR